MEIDAVRMPDAVGVNVTLKVQLAPAPTVEPQVLVCWKSSPSGPVMEMPVKLKAVLPTFVSVNFFAALVVPTSCTGNVRLAGANFTSVPVPVSGTICCGLSNALSVMVTAPVCLWMTGGVKVTVIVQLAPMETVVPHVFVCRKLPLMPMLVIVRASVPLLLSLIHI